MWLEVWGISNFVLGEVAMKYLYPFVLLIALILSGCVVCQPFTDSVTDANNYCIRIKQYIPSIEVITNAALLHSGVAGVYDEDGPESRKRVMGRLSSRQLYIFPDQEYYYTHLSDISDARVYDKGAWACDAGILSLYTDGSFSKKVPSVKKYLVLGYKFGERSTILLMRIKSDCESFVRFAEQSEDFDLVDYEALLLICSYERQSNITHENTEQLKGWLNKHCAGPEDIARDDSPQ